MTLKYSKQRTAIKDFLITRKDHPTADLVYSEIRKEYPNISLGTVYRNLMVLSETGDIQRLHVGDGSDHFDADTSEHNHFVCQKCGRVIDLDMESVQKIDQIAAESFKGRIDGHKLYFYGVCEACLDKAGE